MGNAVAEKVRKKGLTKGFTSVQVRLTAEDLEKIKKVEESTFRKRKDLIRGAIRWLPTSGCTIEKSEKGYLSDSRQFEVLPKEKEILLAIAEANGLSITDALRWIIDNLDWIAEEI